SEITNINPDQKTVTVKTSSGEKEESYDKLFLSPGAVPFELPVPGNDMENVFYLRGREWADAVKKAMPEAKQAVVIGGGYIDRKSTRLNSSHVSTSYAVFCLKKRISTKSRNR